MTDKEPTSRQRSAFSDAVEILNELYREGIPANKIIIAMEHTLSEYRNASAYMNLAYFAKLADRKEAKNDLD